MLGVKSVAAVTNPVVKSTPKMPSSGEISYSSIAAVPLCQIEISAAPAANIVAPATASKAATGIRNKSSVITRNADTNRIVAATVRRRSDSVNANDATALSESNTTVAFEASAIVAVSPPSLINPDRANDGKVAPATVIVKTASPISAAAATTTDDAGKSTNSNVGKTPTVTRNERDAVSASARSIKCKVKL